MVGSFGMAGSLISLEAVRGGGTNIVAKGLSDEVSRQRVDEILDRARDEVRATMSQRAYLVEALRDALLERDELIGPEIEQVLRAAEVRQASEVVDLRDEVNSPSPAVSPHPSA